MRKQQNINSRNKTAHLLYTLRAHLCWLL